MSSVRIISYNCQGLSNNGKRIDVFQHLKEIESDIYCLVDTHFTTREETFISLQWGSDCVFNSKTSNSRGIAILFNSNTDYKIHGQINEDTANYLILDISVQNNRFTLAVIYGPNSDNPQFFKSLFEDIDKLENDSVIICGDFNLVLDPKLDYHNYKQINNKKARQILLEEMEARNLSDPYRILSPLKRRYTWRRRTPFQQSRLDFFVISEDIQHYVNKCDIGISYRSDHSLIMLELNFQDRIKGKPLWKHNNSLLSDIDYINTINNKIKQVKEQYALPVYNLENIDTIPNEEIQFIINDQLFLETLLMELRGTSISFSSYKKKQKDQKEMELIQNIKTIEANLTKEKQDELEDLKSDLEKLRHEKMKGYVIRSRAQWIEEGEKPSKFFCSLENKNFVNKTMYKLNTGNGKIIYDQFQILEEAKTFYSNLYKNNDTDLQDRLSETYLQDSTIPKLNNEESNTLEGDITIEEASITLRNMSNNKSPGSDGFSSEFFKVFWQKLGHFVVRSLNYGFHNGELSITQREGIITCIPKENKPREVLRNWRPITLLNVVFKIASGCIANRLKPFLNKLIHTDQTGFISGRFIGENIRLVYDLMQYTEENNIPGLLLLIDFEKAFDSLSWAFINKVLKTLNFGSSFINWINVFHKNSKSAINQLGHLSNFFYLGRGCRQGDPISPYIFILCAEMLALKVRKNEQIKGIKIGNKFLKIFGYADDTGLILDGSDGSLNETLKELDAFAAVSGLKINYEKTQVIWIGLKKYSQDTIKTKYKLIWGKTSFKLLGIEFSVNLANMLEINFSEKICTVKKQLLCWKRRNLTPIGRITVIKSLLLPKFNHLFLTLPNPSQEMLKTLNNLFQEFVWNGPPRVKGQILSRDYNNGGLKMIDIHKFLDALKLTWIRRILTSGCRNWQQFINMQLNVSDCLSFGFRFINNKCKDIKNLFWKDVFLAFGRFIELIQINTEEKFLACACYYDRINIGNGFFNKNWYDNGIRIVNDFFNENGELYTIEQLKQKYNIKINFLQYHGLKASLKSITKVNKITVTTKLSTPVIPYHIDIILKCKKGTKDMYNIMTENKENIAGQIRWNKIYNIQKEEWKNIYEMPFYVTKCAKLQWFQFRINHKILATNTFLCKINVSNNSLCTFCKNEEETIEHLFWECQKVQEFLYRVKQKFNVIDIYILYSKKEFIFSLENYKKAPERQLLLLEMKYYIYSARCMKQTLNITAFERTLKMFYWIHKQIAANKNELEKFMENWQFLEKFLRLAS